MTKEYEAYLPSELFFFQAEDGIRDRNVTGVQTCALPIWSRQCGRGDEHAYSAGMRRRASDKRHLLHAGPAFVGRRSEEHTSELQSRFDLVCRLLLEKKNTNWSSVYTPLTVSATTELYTVV